MIFKCNIYENIKSPNPYLEPLILKNSKYSYLYSKQILKKPWKKGEKTLLQGDPEFIYLYAKNVLKKRWKKGEEALLCAANFGLNDKPLCRPASRSSWQAARSSWQAAHRRSCARKAIAFYSKHVIKGSWKEAEHFIVETSYIGLYLSVLSEKETKDFMSRITMEAIGGSKQAKKYFAWKPTHRIKIKGSKAFDVMVDTENKNRWGVANVIPPIHRAFTLTEWIANAESNATTALEYDLNNDQWYRKRQSMYYDRAQHNLHATKWFLKGTVTPLG